MKGNAPFTLKKVKKAKTTLKKLADELALPTRRELENIFGKGVDTVLKTELEHMFTSSYFIKSCIMVTACVPSNERRLDFDTVRSKFAEMEMSVKTLEINLRFFKQSLEEKKSAESTSVYEKSIAASFQQFPASSSSETTVLAVTSMKPASAYFL